MAFAITRVPPRSLTASATRRLTYRESQYSQRMTMPWQHRALIHYDLIGEIRFASQFYAKLMSRVRFYPARVERDGRLSPITEGAPVVLLDRIQDPAGGRSRLQYDFGRLMFVTGEGYLFGSQFQGEERWKFLWKDEVKIFEDGTAIRVDRGGMPVQPEDRGYAYRMWNPHPRHSDEADSPLHSVQEIAEELIALTGSVMSTATTRLTNGILALAQEISFGAAEAIGDEDPFSDPFTEDFINHIEAQINNPAAAEAKVPFVIRVPYDYMKDGILWVQTHDPQTDYMERELRKEAVHRLALGMDFPPEFLLGMTDANHWTAKQVVFDMWRNYGVVIAEQFADDLNQAYLRPALLEEGYAGAEDVVIGYDDSQVVVSPDRTEDALKAHKDGLINGEAARLALGWTEQDKMDDDEREEWLAIQLRQPALLGGEAAEMFGPGARGPLAGNTSRNGNAENGPPDPGSRLVSRQEARTASVLIEGNAQAALHRCRELAGIRIRHAAQNQKVPDPCPDCSNSILASVVGPDKIPDPLRLVRGGADGFRTLLIEQHGVDDTQARALQQSLELYAARSLDQERQPELPSGFMAEVEKALEISGAVGA